MSPELTRESLQTLPKRTSPGTPEETRKLELERLFAKIEDQVEEKSGEQIRPKRRVDELGDENRAALVHSALGLVNKVREKVGLERLADLPKARPGDAGACLLARAFDGRADVNGGAISWHDSEIAKAAGQVFEKLDGTAGAEGYGATRNPGTFQEIVNQFDNKGLTPYNTDTPGEGKTRAPKL